MKTRYKVKIKNDVIFLPRNTEFIINMDLILLTTYKIICPLKLGNLAGT
jgi:hypothetical protein